MPRRGLRSGNDTSRVVGYALTDDIDNQRQTLAAWCESEGAELLLVATDSAGAPLRIRPGLEHALEQLLVQQAGILLVAHRGVITIHPVEWAVVDELAERQGGELLSAIGDTRAWADELLIAREAFRAYLALRQGLPIRQGVRERRRKGLKPGGEPPYGYRPSDEGLLVPDEAEQAVIKLATEQRQQKRTLKQIVELLEARGIRNRAGKQFDQSTISRLIARTREETDERRS